MRGIVDWGSYLPHWRLERAHIAAFVGQGGGKGVRTVASYDEDPSTMAVEAARRIAGVESADVLMFASTAPAYADKTNATVVHAALRLSGRALATDLGQSARSATAGLLLASCGSGTTLVAAADIRRGWAGSADEAAGGDGAVAVLFASHSPERPVLAEVVASASATEEFVDRWRAPGEARTKSWDERFAELTYGRLGADAWKQALAQAGVAAADVSLVAVAAPAPRIGSSLAAKLGAPRVIDDRSQSIGATGAAQAGLALVDLLEQAEPGQLVALVSLADGADVLLLRTTPALAAHRPTVSVAAQAEGGATLSYGRFLSWRGNLNVEPPRRPEPQRVSATAAARSDDWKFGFVAGRDQTTGQVHMPPQRVSADGTRTDQMEPAPMAGVAGTVATFTIDHVAYSPSPPVVFAVVDFDGGGRLPIELCDCAAAEVSIGMRVEPTFRRLFVQDGLPNYFWKARPLRG
ncbi:MAG: OB-fold domain-containing protein [Actinomycetota bacterium]